MRPLLGMPVNNVVTEGASVPDLYWADDEYDEFGELR